MTPALDPVKQACEQTERELAVLVRLVRVLLIFSPIVASFFIVLVAMNFVLIYQAHATPQELYRELVTFREEQKLDRAEQEEFRAWRRGQTDVIEEHFNTIEQRISRLIESLPKEQ